MKINSELSHTRENPSTWFSLSIIMARCQQEPIRLYFFFLAPPPFFLPFFLPSAFGARFSSVKMSPGRDASTWNDWILRFSC